MKKIRVGSIVLLMIAAAVFVSFRVYERMNNDTTPPVITYPEGELELSVKADENELLKDVEVEDEKSGDVSESLVVESLSDFTEEGTRIITYAAIDANGNVARKERVLRYTDYTKPVFKVNGKLRYPMGKTINVLDRITAESSLDGNLTDNIKYFLEGTINVMAAGKYPIEYRVMDSGGNTTYLSTEIEVYDASKKVD